MSKQDIRSWIRRASSEGWAIGEFNVYNMETMKGVLAAANELRSPVIIGITMGGLAHAGLNYVTALCNELRAEAEVPLFVHLDHGADFDTVRAVIKAGFDSVMLDVSRLPYEENVKTVREAAEFAHAAGVGFEAQIGETWDEETGEQRTETTRPEDLTRYVEATGVDYLAVSFGNTPGRTDGLAEPDLSLLLSLLAASPVPLVMHGGTSIPDSVLRTAINAGAAKVNIDTHIKRAVNSTLEHAYKGSYNHDPRVQFRELREAVKKAAAEKMQLFGSIGKADAR